MRLTHFDFGSDGTIFFFSIIVVLTIIVIAMDRLSPKRKARRRVDQRASDRAGELID